MTRAKDWLRLYRLGRTMSPVNNMNFETLLDCMGSSPTVQCKIPNHSLLNFCFLETKRHYSATVFKLIASKLYLLLSTGSFHFWYVYKVLTIIFVTRPVSDSLQHWFCRWTELKSFEKLNRRRLCKSYHMHIYIYLMHRLCVHQSAYNSFGGGRLVAKYRILNAGVWIVMNISSKNMNTSGENMKITSKNTSIYLDEKLIFQEY
jgi:hypothetical protein